MPVPGVGPALAARLARRNITTRAQMRRVIDELPPTAQAHLRHEIVRPIPGATAAAIAAELRARLTFSRGGRRRRLPVVPVGSVRRGAAETKDLDLLVVVPAATDVAGLLASAGLARRRAHRDTLSFVETYASGDRRRSLVVRQGSRNYAVDLFLATAAEKPYALLHYTGSKVYNIRLRARAKRNGLTLNQYGLFRRGTTKKAPGSRAVRTERDLTKLLGVTYRRPDARV